MDDQEEVEVSRWMAANVEQSILQPEDPTGTENVRTEREWKRE